MERSLAMEDAALQPALGGGRAGEEQRQPLGARDPPHTVDASGKTLDTTGPVWSVQKSLSTLQQPSEKPKHSTAAVRKAYTLCSTPQKRRNTRAQVHSLHTTIAAN